MYSNYEKLRNAKGVTDYKVAIETGIPKSTFSDWKSGRSKPKMDKLMKIAAYFGVTVDELMKELVAVECQTGHMVHTGQ